MVKLIIEFRDFDIDNNKLDNSEAINEITNHAQKYWNCDNIEMEQIKGGK